MMATYASGTSNSGWSYVLSVGSAMKEYLMGQTDGILFLLALRRVDDKHSINISGFTLTRGKNSPNMR
jgi:hypothetical protein